jgi:hypothetical protein
MIAENLHNTNRTLRSNFYKIVKLKRSLNNGYSGWYSSPEPPQRIYIFYLFIAFLQSTQDT